MTLIIESGKSKYARKLTGTRCHDHVNGYRVLLRNIFLIRAFRGKINSALRGVSVDAMKYDMNA